MRNKKGIETGLSDFYATIVIFLIILVFFFVLKIRVDQTQYSVKGEQLSLDATQIALVYAQSHVETSDGKMTFADFIARAAADKTLTSELEEKTKEFFMGYKDVLDYGLHWKIVTLQNNEEEVLITDHSYSYFSKGQLGAPTVLLLPLQNPGDFIKIEISIYAVTPGTILQSEIEQ
ncbi:hypothetical protein HZA99_01815 [Candidatus Woesearchaeota archaeon]|nr:hypothetical protein [Candidatus Woesearchaeota archaeon]